MVQFEDEDSNLSGYSEVIRHNSIFHQILLISPMITYVHQQITLLWTVLDRVTQNHRAPSLVHAGHMCPSESELVAHCTASHRSLQMYGPV